MLLSKILDCSIVALEKIFKRVYLLHMYIFLHKTLLPSWCPALQFYLLWHAMTSQTKIIFTCTKVFNDLFIKINYYVQFYRQSIAKL